MREARNVVQHKGEPRRRWFLSPYFDLIVWYNEGETIRDFELCYGKPDSEKVLCWSKVNGYKHHKVDDGETEPLKYKMTPIYVPDGLFDKSTVAERFIEESINIEQEVRDYVVNKISSFNF